MEIPRKLDPSKLPDGFKKQICEYLNDLRECIIELKMENKKLKEVIKNGK
jgi:hypothetical protein